MSPSTLTTSGLITYGLYPHINDAVEAWGHGGVDGLIAAATEHAPLATQCFDTIYALCADGITGAFDYEVSQPFGTWYGQHVAHYGDLPTRMHARAQMIDLAVAFAVRCSEGLMISCVELRDALGRLDG